eukprot:TRINITY_DN56014_c0_g1_i1.p1 TRINITY_DN56014_c0_g1~~TRINITY_DN56014_c0_g1_i1.p1  ORF type:complete len:321 (+),score=25.14 TRINITY_DN56014_c0_g1_i1:56-1018(+)
MSVQTRQTGAYHPPSMAESIFAGITSTTITKSIMFPFMRLHAIQQVRGLSVRNTINELKNDGFIRNARILLLDCCRSLSLNVLNTSVKPIVAALIHGIGGSKPLSSTQPGFSAGYLMMFAKLVVSGGVATSLVLVLTYPLEAPYLLICSGLDKSLPCVDADVDESQDAAGAVTASVPAHESAEEEHSVSVLSTMQRLVAAGGVARLFSGLPLAIVGAFFSRCVHYVVWDGMRVVGHDAGPRTRVALGFLCTLVAGGACYPMQTVQQQQLASGQSVGDAFRTARRRGMYQGYPMTMVRGLLSIGGMLAFSAVAARRAAHGS